MEPLKQLEDSAEQAKEDVIAAMNRLGDVRSEQARLLALSQAIDGQIKNLASQLEAGEGAKQELTRALTDAEGQHKEETSRLEALENDTREVSEPAQNAQAFVSAGSTGALFLGGMVTLRMLPGISRPALAAVLPGLNAPFMLLDCGANADCQPEYLKQFGLMGSVYMDRVMNVKEPKVGLVNIGAEEEKGSKLYKEAHQLMKAQKVYTFCGNVEARDIQLGDAQVVVADGFTGNVILKYAEGLSSALFKMIKTEIMSTTRGKLGGLMLKPAFGSVKTRMNKDEYGGAPLLGVNGCVVP